MKSPVARGDWLPTSRQIIVLALCLCASLMVLFWQGFLPGRTVFSNDGPLGAISSRAADLPSGFLGFWQDLNLLGAAGTSASPDITQTFNLLSGKVLFSKFFPAFSLFFLGLGAWFCFWQWRFSPLACVLGGLAAGLNGDFFSTACWGVVTQPIAFGLSFIAVGLLADDGSTRSRQWVKTALGGFAVGMGVMEAFDIGAIFSLFVAAFVVYQGMIQPRPPAQKAIISFTRLAVVAGCAGFIAAAALVTLVGTQIKGIAGMEGNDISSQEQWDRATQWSLPKREILDVMLPGIYGFRMDSPDGAAYWGAGGRDPSWDRYFESGKQGPPPQGAIRFSGGGHYAGALVLLGAAWAFFQSLRKRASVFTDTQRRMIWFWAAVTLLAMLLAFGRFAPFYQFFFALPYASTIRNPAKFIHVFEWALVILFAYGLHGLSTTYLSTTAAATDEGPVTRLKLWWERVQGFDRAWVRGMGIFFGALLLGWLAYSQSRGWLITYLQEVAIDPADAPAVAAFSIRQPGWFILFYAGSALLFALAMSGYFGGRRRALAGVLMGTLLVVDLARANAPWVVTYDYRQKYASNAVVDFLRENAHEHRVTLLPLERFLRLEALPPEARAIVDQYSYLRHIYQIEWMQHQFQYYNIQSLDLVQMPRMPADYEAFIQGVAPNPLRYWQLTNTKFFLGPVAMLEFLNERLDPLEKRFRLALQFAIVPKEGVSKVTTYADLTAVASTNGAYALFEFTGALPRAKLYGNWQVITNDAEVLRTLASPAFDPRTTLLISEPIQGQSSSATNELTGNVAITSYAPKDIVLKTAASIPAILLHNDKYDPNWKAYLNGKPVALARCNYIMRGVAVPAGEHTVRLSYEPPIIGLFISLAAIAVAIALMGWLGLTRERDRVVDKRRPEEDSSTAKPRK